MVVPSVAELQHSSIILLSMELYYFSQTDPLLLAGIPAAENKYFDTVAVG